MGKSLKDKLIELKKEREIKFVNFFNDGSVKKDEAFMQSLLNRTDSISAIGDTMSSACRSYSYDSEFDRIDMDLLLGLVYDVKDVNEDDTIKEGAEPLKNIVRYYTGSIRSYADNMQTNRADYYCYGVNRQGFINYNELIRSAQKEGLSFNGPESFEEFKNLVLSNVKFNVLLSADLKQDNEMKLGR